MSSPAPFAAHRKRLMKQLADGPILLSGGREVQRNYDVNYVFRQRSEFLYLTGVEEPGCYLLLDPKKGRQTLFIPRVDDHHRVWEGHVPGPAEAKRLFGVPRVVYADQLEGEVRAAAKGAKKVYADPAAFKAAKLRSGLANKAEVLEDTLWDLRAVKTPGEIELLKRASEVSGRAHEAVMAQTRPGMREYEIQAIFEAHCMRAGLKHLAYPSIIAAGANGAVLHYRRNDAPLKNGELLLIDAGAECRGYGADITRTFPANGRFTQRQRDIYSIVLEAQEQCIEKVTAGTNSAEIHVHSMKVIAEGLQGLGILKGSVEELVVEGAVRLFYPHGVGHLLGLDVHDGMGGKRRVLPNPTGVPVRFVAKLEPGFVMTVEPGIYFIEALLKNKRLRHKHRKTIDFAKAEAFLDFGGVRIEDDVVVRPEGPPLNLTDVPKSLSAVEAACRR